jgi:hypothetical protein
MVLALLAVPLLAACGGTKASTVAPTPDLSATAILDHASRQLASTQTVHFTLTVEGQTFIDAQHTMQLLSAEGDLERPNKVSTSFKVKVANSATVGLKLITIGTKSWWTNIITGKWGPAPPDLGYNPTILFDNQGGIGPVMGKVKDPTRLADATIDGQQTYHVQAQVAESVIGPLTDNTMTGSPITVDLWIDAKTYDLLRAQLAEPSQPGKPHPATWVLDLSNQNKKVTIEQPT